MPENLQQTKYCSTWLNHRFSIIRRIALSHMAELTVDGLKFIGHCSQLANLSNVFKGQLI